MFDWLLGIFIGCVIGVPLVLILGIALDWYQDRRLFRSQDHDEVDEMMKHADTFTKETEMKPLAMYRQGDVLLVKLVKTETKMKRLNEVPLERVILAYGEVTGHAHVLECEKVRPLMKHPKPDKAAWDAGAERFIHVLEETSLKHLNLPRHDAPTGEHADVKLEPGLYKVVRQREWSDEMERYVSD